MPNIKNKYDLIIKNGTIIDGTGKKSYRAKCLKWLKDEYEILENNHKKLIDNFLYDTGCELLFNGK